MNLYDFTQSISKYARIQPYGAPNFNDPEVADFWFTALKGVDPGKLSGALTVLCQEAKFPSIKQVLEKCGVVQQSEEDLARDAISRIREAVGRFGYMNWHEARQYIGSVGEHAVKLMGGWTEVCAFESYKEMDFALAQTREALKVAIKKDRAGLIDTPPELPSAKQTPKAILDLAEKVALGGPKRAVLGAGMKK